MGLAPGPDPEVRRLLGELPTRCTGFAGLVDHLIPARCVGRDQALRPPGADDHFAPM